MHVKKKRMKEDFELELAFLKSFFSSFFLSLILGKLLFSLNLLFYTQSIAYVDKIVAFASALFLD